MFRILKLTIWILTKDYWTLKYSAKATVITINKTNENQGKQISDLKKDNTTNSNNRAAGREPISERPVDWNAV